LPNLLDKDIGESHFYFNSQAPIKNNPAFVKLIKGFEPLEIEKEIVRVMCREINNRLNLSLVGFDLIRETKTGVYYLIDINYFPSFKGFEGFRETFHNHFYNRYKSFNKK